MSVNEMAVQNVNPSLTLETQTPYESHSQTFYPFYLKKNTGWFSRKMHEVRKKNKQKVDVIFQIYIAE
jgi:hypothetical protein